MSKFPVLHHLIPLKILGDYPQMPPLYRDPWGVQKDYHQVPFFWLFFWTKRRPILTDNWSLRKRRFGIWFLPFCFLTKMAIKSTAIEAFHEVNGQCANQNLQLIWAPKRLSIFWHSVWHSVRHTFWHSIWHSLWHMFFDILSDNSIWIFENLQTLTWQVGNEWKPRAAKRTTYATSSATMAAKQGSPPGKKLARCRSSHRYNHRKQG